MKKCIYSLLICCLLLGSTPNIKASYYSYGFMDYIYLITEIILAGVFVANCKLLYEKEQLQTNLAYYQS